MKADGVDHLDRVLDKGIVIDGSHVSLAGALDLRTIETRIIVASIETCLEHAEAIGHTLRTSHDVLPLVPSAFPRQDRD